MERLQEILLSVFPVTVKIEFVPILLGALFKETGTPMVSNTWDYCYVLILILIDSCSSHEHY